MVNTIPIMFHGGSYGTYLEWVLHTLTTDVAIAEPFNNNGNSHAYEGRHVGNLPGWRKYLASNDPAAFVRLHPKDLANESISDNLNEIMTSVNRMIYIHPDTQTMLLMINNSFTKIWEDWWLNQFTVELDVGKIYKNWPVNPNTPADQIPMWIRREFLSFYLMPQLLSQIEWNHLESWSHPGTLPVLVHDLLYNFENTINQIQDFCNLKFTKSVVDLLPSHARMLELQVHRHQDRTAQRIIDSVTNQTEFDWQNTPTTLATESWIQWQLRNLGYEIQCHGLDIFPTNSVQLQDLLYKS